MTLRGPISAERCSDTIVIVTIESSHHQRHLDTTRTSTQMDYRLDIDWTLDGHELDMDWIHPWIGLGWVGLDWIRLDCDPVFKLVIIAERLMLFISK